MEWTQASTPHRIRRHGKIHQFQLPASFPGFRRCGYCGEYTVASYEVCAECELALVWDGKPPAI